jgi:ABC-2 type transport system permease protein
MAWSAFSDLTWTISREAQWGTLEQLYMTTYRFESLMILKSAINVLLSFLTGALILLLMMVTTQQFVSVDILTIVPIVFLGLGSVVGIGFIFAGLAIIYKRIEAIFQLLSFGLIGLITAPVESIPLLKLLPLAQSSYLLQLAMENGVHLWGFDIIEIGILIVVFGAYLGIGLIFFHLAQNRARKLGVMGHY